jgi:hypothetical protein
MPAGHSQHLKIIATLRADGISARPADVHQAPPREGTGTCRRTVTVGISFALTGRGSNAVIFTEFFQVEGVRPESIGATAYS